MPVTTVHQFIDQHPVQPHHTRLLLGSIHPHQIEHFAFPYFYGYHQLDSFWSRLAEAFPNQTFDTLEAIVQTVADHHVWVSDMIRQCERAHIGVARDKGLYNLVLNTDQIREGLRQAPIDTIYFTSVFAAQKFGQAFSFSLPVDLITQTIPIPDHLFERAVTGVVLYSPSKRANVGISQSSAYRDWVATQRGQPVSVDLFRIAHYQEKLSFFAD